MYSRETSFKFRILQGEHFYSVSAVLNIIHSIWPVFATTRGYSTLQNTNRQLGRNHAPRLPAYPHRRARTTRTGAGVFVGDFAYILDGRRNDVGVLLDFAGNAHVDVLITDRNNHAANKCRVNLSRQLDRLVRLKECLKKC